MRLSTEKKWIFVSETRSFNQRSLLNILGSVIHRPGRIDDEVTHRIESGWARMEAASGVYGIERVPLKVLADHESLSKQGGSREIENVEVDLWSFRGKRTIYDEKDELQENDSEFLQSGTVQYQTTRE
ncbi:hypothetical protein Tco_0727105 [Tanacetum coccineum]|uniref:Uncharacterized protein n=1 Tax=Tanacetum coccineum TaxID=301880 RepID=A0ABQ4YHG8_9ASTR